MVIEEEAVDAEVEKSLSKLETQEDIDAYFDSVGLDARSYRDLIRRQLYHKQFLTEVYEVHVTEQEAQDHYKRYKRRYDKKAEVKASHILFKFSSSRPSPEEVEKKRKEAVSVAQMARQPGANFAELARQYSEGPSGPKGGDLGYFQANRMVRPFSDKAFSMQVGEVSEPVKTRFGWHVIRVEDRKPARLIPFKKIHKKLKIKLLQKKLIQTQNIFLHQTKNKHNIKYLTHNIHYHKKKTPSTQPHQYPKSQPHYP